MTRSTSRLLGALMASALVLSSCTTDDAEPAPSTDSHVAEQPGYIEQATLEIPEGDAAADYFSQVLNSEEVEQAFGELDRKIWSTPEDAEQVARADSTEFAVLPIPVAARAFHDGAPLKLTAATFWDVLALFGTEAAPEDPSNTAHWAEPLKGGTVATALPADSVPVLALHHILERNEVPDVSIETVDSPAAAAEAVQSGEAAAALDYATADNGLQPQFILQDEWARTTGLMPRLFSMGLVVNRDVLAEHREAVRALVQAATVDGDRVVLPARDIASELDRFCENLGPEAERAFGAPTIDAEFFAQRRP